MKSFLPLLSLVIIFSNCTTAYKSGQTPDDVYFSPARPTAEYVSNETKNENQYLNNGYSDDQYLRMKVHNRRWSSLDDGYYSYNPNYYSYINSGFYYNSPWNPYTYWNYCYNPYYSGVVVVSQKTPVYNSPRRFNLNTYVTPASSNNKGVKVYSSNSYGSTNNNTGNYHNSGTNAGNFLRNVFNNSGSSNNSSSSNNNSGTRTSPSASSSSGSSGGGSSSSGGHAGVRRF